MLKELILFLESMPRHGVVRHGFGGAMSWRGDYCQLAFEPKENASIEDMLREARSALGATFEGYKGGDFTMHEYTDCYISEYGSSSGDRIGPVIMAYWKEDCDV